jgi:hypothetical protein
MLEARRFERSAHMIGPSGKVCFNAGAPGAARTFRDGGGERIACRHGVRCGTSYPPAHREAAPDRRSPRLSLASADLLAGDRRCRLHRPTPGLVHSISQGWVWVAKGILVAILVTVTPAALMQRESPHAMQTACQVCV